MVQRRHIEPDDRREDFDFFQIETRLYDQFVEGCLALDEQLFPVYVDEESIRSLFDGEKIGVHDVVVDSEIMVEFRDIVVHVTGLEQPSEILSPIEQAKIILGLEDIVEDKIPMEKRLFARAKPIEIDFFENVANCGDSFPVYHVFFVNQSVVLQKSVYSFFAFHVVEIVANLAERFIVHFVRVLPKILFRPLEEFRKILWVCRSRIELAFGKFVSEEVFFASLDFWRESLEKFCPFHPFLGEFRIGEIFYHERVVYVDRLFQFVQDMETVGYFFSCPVQPIDISRIEPLLDFFGFEGKSER